MKCPLNAGSIHRAAWKGLLLTGALLAFSVSTELPSSAFPDFWTEGASAHLPVPSNLGDILSASWYRGHEAQPETMIFSTEGLPGPGHTGREMQDTQGSLVIRNVTTQDSGSYTMVLETSRGRRSVTEQIRVKANSKLVLVQSFPDPVQDVIQSDLNYSVILECLTTVSSNYVLYWTFDGEPCGTRKDLIIRRLSREHLGTYVCVVNSTQGQYFSTPVNISLPQENVDPTEMPIEPDSTLTVSGGAAVVLLLAGNVGMVILLAGIGSTIAQAIRWLLNASLFTREKTPSHRSHSYTTTV